MELTEDQAWAIVCAPVAVTTSALAEKLGVPQTEVNRARWQFRRNGWRCMVGYRVCTICGGGLTNDLPRNARRTYHPACYASAQPTIEQARNVERWAAVRALTGRNVVALDDQVCVEPGTKRSAQTTRQSRHWTDVEDAWLIDRADVATVSDIAESLARTIPSVIARRQKLRSKGRIA